MKPLWAPWRMEYILGDRKPGGCVFCQAVKEGQPDRELLVLHVTEHCAVIMNRYPYTNGHLLVMPRRHTSDFASLTAEENSGIMHLLNVSHAAIKEAMRPDGFNMGCNLGRTAGAGIEDHLHWHIVPRWSGDVNFMTLISEIRMIPQHILETYDLLYPLIQKRL